MHVLVVLTYGVSLKDWEDNGLLDREMKLYEKLSKDRDVHFTFLSFGNSEDSNIVKNFNVIPVYEHIEKGDGKFRNFLGSFFVPFRVKKIIEKPDIIKTNQLMGSWVAIVFSLIYSKSLIIRTGYDPYSFSIYEKKSVFKRSAYFLLTQVSIIFSSIYIVTSKVDKVFLKNKFLKTKNKIHILPNWVDASYKYDLSETKVRYKDKVLSVGRLEAQKDYSFLISSFKNLGIEIDIVGSGSEKEKLIELSSSNNVKVNFLGRYSNNELLDIYKKYNIFVSTSSYEGNSKSILEAMSSGCVVVARNNINNQEIITNGKNGLLFKNKSDLQEIIQKLTNNDEMILNISQNAIDYIKQNNSLELISNNEYKLYEKVYKF